MDSKILPTPTLSVGVGIITWDDKTSLLSAKLSHASAVAIT